MRRPRKPSVRRHPRAVGSLIKKGRRRRVRKNLIAGKKTGKKRRRSRRS